jgi:hypothetical protein
MAWQRGPDDLRFSQNEHRDRRAQFYERKAREENAYGPDGDWGPRQRQSCRSPEARQAGPALRPLRLASVEHSVGSCGRTFTPPSPMPSLRPNQARIR